MLYPIKKVVKRDGKITDFVADKVTNAIYRAAKAVGGKNRKRALELTDRVIELVVKEFGEDCNPTVEQLQDCVEKVLIEQGHAKTAKAYILYRETHGKLRETRSVYTAIQSTIDEYLTREDWRTQENSNTDFSFSGLVMHAASKVIANYALNEIYTNRIRSAHRNSYIHIHDLSQGIVGYCAGWSMNRLLVEGFGGVRNKVKAYPAKHMDVLVAQMVNFIGTMQMEFAGAQAFSSVDTYLAPFVRSDNLTYLQVKQNIQKLVFSLNVPSRWGSQTPFSNLTFDLVAPDDLKDKPVIIGGEEQDTNYGDYQKEMDMINKAFLEVMLLGDANGRIFSFPIPTYNITNNFKWNSEISELLFKVTAKYGTPYFQNYCGSNLDPSSIRAMCCRLNLNMKELMNRPGGMWSMGDSTGSIGVVTLNLPRIAYEAKTKKEFLTKITKYMDISKESLEMKREIVNKNMKNGLMPFAKHYLGTFKNHFSTIGMVGMHEACLNLIGKGLETDEGIEFAVETLEYMRKRLTKYQKETGNLYNLEASPAESTSYRFAKEDKKRFKHANFSGTEETPYYTNSTQLPVGITDDLFFALEHQNKIQPLYTGGTMFHTFLGEELTDHNVCKDLVKKIAMETKLPYFSITPTFSICKEHGYLSGKQLNCPKCNEQTEVYSRIVGYYRPIQSWNKGKKQEFVERQTYSAENYVENNSTSKKNILPEIKNIEDKFLDNTILRTNNEISKEMVNNFSSYKMFYSDTCSNCIPVKSYLSKKDVSGEMVNVSREEGLKQANEFNVMTTPTVIFFDKMENIVETVTTLRDVKKCV